MCPLQWPSGGVGVSAWGGRESTQGGVCLGGCLPGGVCLGEHRRDTTPTPEQNDWKTGVKTLPCRNYVAEGNYKNN